MEPVRRESYSIPQQASKPIPIPIPIQMTLHFTSMPCHARHWGDESGNRKMVDDPRVGVMSEKNVMREVVDGYVQRGLPLHVLVMDMVSAVRSVQCTVYSVQCTHKEGGVIQH